MFWFMVMQVVSTLLDLVKLGRQTDEEKDLEILLHAGNLPFWKENKTNRSESREPKN